VELRAVFAVHRREDVVFLHRRSDRDVRGFVAEARGIRAELAGALQRDGLAVEHAHEQHFLVQRDEFAHVARDRGQVVADELAVGVEVLQVFDFECGGGGQAGLRCDAAWAAGAVARDARVGADREARQYERRRRIRKAGRSTRRRGYTVKFATRSPT
jgi:hypothetical protein